MPWCHNCKMEYCEGIERCADCGAKLLDDAPEQGGRSEREALAKGVYRPVILLRAGVGAREADWLGSLLDDAGITVFRQGGRAAGLARKGVNLFVYVEQLEHARSLIEASSHYAADDLEAAGRSAGDGGGYAEDEDEMLWPDEEDEFDGYVREGWGRRDMRRVLSWVMLAVFLCGALGYTIYTIYAFLR